MIKVHNFSLKMYQESFGGRAPPKPASWIQGWEEKKKEGRGSKKGEKERREGRAGERGEEGKGEGEQVRKGREGKGRGGEVATKAISKSRRPCCQLVYVHLSDIQACQL